MAMHYPSARLHAYLVEIGSHVAGVALHESGGYRFVAIKSSFHALDGVIFESADVARSAALDLCREADQPRSGVTLL